LYARKAENRDNGQEMVCFSNREVM